MLNFEGAFLISLVNVGIIEVSNATIFYVRVTNV